MNLYPAEIVSYDAAKRTARIKIPGLTAGDSLLPEAQFLYPLGDKASGAAASEIEVNAGDRAWVGFINGDARYPLIIGYRNQEAANSVEWRRWHHANMELAAAKEINIKAGAHVNINCVDATITATGKATLSAPTTHCSGDLNVDGDVTVKKSVTATGNIASSSGSVADRAGSLKEMRSAFDSHTHSGVKGGSDNSGTPNSTMSPPSPAESS